MTEQDKKIYVSQKAVIYNEEGKILAIRRTKTAPSRPLYWDLPGGELDFGEDAKTGMVREIKEETGLDVNQLALLNVIAAFDGKDEFWVTICYTAQAAATDVVLSFEHDQSKWITPGAFKKLKASPRNKKFVAKFATTSSKP